MSAGEQQAATSFGEPNARPHTPQRTPTAGFASPPPQTPNQNQSVSLADDPSAWTPRFAEDFSVFNSTPGNLGGSSSRGALKFDLFASVSPVAQSTGKKRSLSTEGLPLDTATHATLSTAAHPALAPVTASRPLPSSPNLLNLSHKDVAAESANAQPRVQHQGQQRSVKKARTASASSGGAAKSPFLASKETQTATPPPSSRGGRKLAPKPRTASMQQNQGFPQPGFSSVPPPQPQLDTNFAPTGNADDVFGYPMAPATAPAITGPRFWGFDMHTNGLAIDVDLAAAGTDLFGPVQNQGHRQMDSMDWGRANEIFQQSGMVTQSESQDQQQVQHSQQQNSQQNQQNQSSRRERTLAPKMANMSTPNMPSPNQNFNFGHMQMSMDTNPFSASPGGVDPGMLFSQPPLATGVDSSAMSMIMSTSRDHMPLPTSSAPANLQETTASRNTESAASEASMSGPAEPPGAGSQNSKPATGQDRGKRKQLGRPRAVSPTKSSGRPNLSRSFSESARGGKRTMGGGRSLLPALAPLRPVTVHQPSPPLPPQVSQSSNRPQTQGGPSGGRRSPLKSSHHHRLSSLTSIPENASNLLSRSRSAKRTSVKFVIDENGRARTETIADDDDDDDEETEPELDFELTLPVSSSQRSVQRNSWAGPPSVPSPIPVSDEEYSSSEDDEPIIIPSRNTSFNYPDPPKTSGSGSSRPPTAANIFNQQRMYQRSFSDHHPFTQSSRFDTDNDAMDVDTSLQHPQQPPPRPSTGGSLGDAASELRKVMQAGISRLPTSGQQPPSLLGSAGGRGHRQRFTPGQRSSSSTISEASLPETSPTQQSQVRCVCNRPNVGDGGFLVKCDSCDSLLHGRCVDVRAPQDRPHVYICAFCANTPNMRGGRMRYTGRATTGGGVGALDLMGPPVQASSAAAAAAAASSPLAPKSFRAFR